MDVMPKWAEVILVPLISLLLAARSVVNSPTISSRMSSSVTRPWTAPYSSTTMAMRSFLLWKLNNWVCRGVLSGMKYGSMVSWMMVALFIFSTWISLPTLRRCRMPMILSISRLYMGSSVCWALPIWLRISSISSSISRPIISFFGTRISFTVTFSRSRIFSSMPCRRRGTRPLDSSTTVRNSSGVSCCWLSSILDLKPSRRTSPLDTKFTIQTTG